MKAIEMKTGGYAIYDAPPALKRFFEARESGNASKELLAQLSADAMAEHEAERLRAPREPGAVVIDFDRARLARSQFAPTGQFDQLLSEIAPEAS